VPKTSPIHDRSPLRGRLTIGALIALVPCLTVLPARASGLTGDTLDAVADAMSWFVICVVPLIAIALFWMVHVMPEKIAHRRHHPQTKAIQVLCLLSLAFGGLLWPLAWLWAYSRPTAYKMAYGTDRHPDYHLEMGTKASEGSLSTAELVYLRDDLDAMQSRGALPPELTALRARLDAMLVVSVAASAAPSADAMPTVAGAA